jgi:uncharacterized membrane protein (DUF485 family)
MLHEPAAQLGKDHSIKKKARLGVILFFVYLAVYAGFVVIGTLWPRLLGVESLFGQNLAVVYGMGLIILAAVMGVIYNYFCTRYEDELNKEDAS